MLKKQSCAECKHGKSLRIHILSGDLNYEKGRHSPYEECKDFEVKNEVS